MPLPVHGRPADEVLAELESFKARDVAWRDGRALTLAYSAGPEVVALQARAYEAYLTENGLNTDAFPSLAHLQREVVGTVAEWLDGGDDAAGFLTSGGTESLVLTVLAARERARAERGEDRPNMVLPASAHAAFEKGAFYLGVESRRVPVGPDWKADPDAMAAAADEHTVLFVASAPQYPQGVIDPVAEVAALADDSGVSCHVDACMGGGILPFLRRLGEPIRPWTFEVPGVTSISVDLHKFGYTAKGASVLVHRTKQLRRHQTFLTDNWLGGLYGSSGVLGTKSGGAWAAAWAVMQHLGDDGYLRLARIARDATLELAAAIDGMPELVLRAWPEATLFAVGATDPDQLDVFAVADALWRRGWYVDRQGPPPSLHCTVNAVHEGRIGELVEALRDSVTEVLASGSAGGAGAYGTVE